jgi:hypothetical protein
MSETEREYAHNYRKPPLHTRFKKGQSGNPRGRPAKNLAALVEQGLHARHPLPAAVSSSRPSAR